MAETGIELSDRLAGIVESSGRSVVRVLGRRRSGSSGIVWAPDVVVTAHHTLERDEDIQVGLPDGQTATASLVGRDPTTDLAVLRLSGGALSPVAWSDDGATKVGHLVLCLSRPGRTVRASLGIVSVLGESWRTPSGGRLERYLQTDVALHAGFSGSLLVDLAGRGLGLNTAGLLRGLSTAVPAATLRRVVTSVLSHGQVRRGFLGVGSFPVQLPADLARSAGQPSALLLVSVQPDGPAAQAGLLLGDALLGLEGTPVSQVGDLLPFLEEDRVGRELTARILRAGQVQEVRIVVGTRGGSAS
jgi:S1-C subfamily serine protease